MSRCAPREFRSIAIDQHLTKMFGSIVSGNRIDRADLLAKLDKYGADAAKFGDVYVQGRVQSVRGTVYLTASDLAMAAQCYQDARALFAQENCRDQIFGMDNNLGLLQAQRGNYAAALDRFYDCLSSLADDDDPNRSSKESMVRINLGMTLLWQFDFAKALATLESSLSDYANVLDYVREHSSDAAFVVEQRVFLGMAQLGIGNHDEALSSASLAMEFAEQTNTVYTRLLALALVVRLSGIVTVHLHGVTDVLEQMDSVLATGAADLNNFCLLREESRFHAALGRPETARWYGERALAMSGVLGNAELRATAEEALSMVGGS